MEHICNSGGAKGADFLFGNLALEAGHEVRHWSFLNHHSTCPEHTIVLSPIFLVLADPHLRVVNEKLGRRFPTRSEYVNNLLRRNFYQVKDSDRVYASTPFDEEFTPKGGTAWAILMAINLGVEEIYNFDHVADNWYEYTGLKRYEGLQWKRVDLDTIPKPYGRYAGIGSSELPDNGRKAIESLYKM